MAKQKEMKVKITAIDRVSKVLKKITGSLKKWGLGALKITGSLTAAVGGVAAAFGAMYAKLSASIDEQAKIASSLGLSNEVLGVFRDAADYAGISAENLTTALRKMSQGVADAADGTGEAKDALEALGLDASKLQKDGPERAFRDIVRELDKMPEGIKKTQILMDLFGRSGVAMGNLTSQGLRQAQSNADKLGLKLSTAQAKGVEAANDAWSRIKNAGSDFLKYVAAKLAPGIKQNFDKAFEFIKGQDLEAWGTKAAYGVATAFQSAVVVLGAAGEAVIAMVRGLAVAVDLTNQLVGGVAAIRSANAKGKLEDIQAEKQRMENSPFAGMSQKALERLTLEEERAQSTLDTYTKIADSAVKIDASLKTARQFLATAQGFSQSKAMNAALKNLEGAMSQYSQEQEKTKKQAEETGGTMKMAFSGTAEAAAIAGDKMARINSILADMKTKAEAAAGAINAIPPMPNQVNIGGGPNLVEELNRQLEEEAER